MLTSPLVYFTDAVLRAPTIGCILMCICAALVGMIVFLKKESLIGETLSHAAFPGVILGIALAGITHIDEDRNLILAIFIMGGAFITAICGLLSIIFLERYFSIRPDSALCFVLSAFFGIGLTIASQVQFSFSTLYRQVQVYLYGQAATMTDVHILIYGFLLIIILLVLIFFYKEIYIITFDRQYARSIGINIRYVDTLIFILIVLAVVIGIRSVGVVLMSAMLIAPAAAARQYTNKFHLLLILSAFFGALSAFLGNYLSVEMAKFFNSNTTTRLTFPTGPMIVIIASLICLFSLTFAPERGFLLRLLRVGAFRYQCMCENLLKAIWRIRIDRPVTFEEIAKTQSASTFYIKFILKRLLNQGWIDQTKEGYRLTPEGAERASRIVRLHRLWEVYLVDYLGVGAERVHRNAEEMEHIITPELEKSLTILLKNPKYDPHHQPIPAEGK